MQTSIPHGNQGHSEETLHGTTASPRLVQKPPPTYENKRTAHKVCTPSFKRREWHIASVQSDGFDG